MAITINYITNEILVPKADTVFVEFDAITGREKRQLDMDDFWKALADLQDNPSDVWAATAFVNTPPQDLGTFTLGRSVVIQSPYFVTFEDGTYSVNLINGNSNVQARSTVNSVQILPNNTGGLVVGTGGGSTVWTETQRDQVLSDTAAVVAKLPTDGNNIASDAQVAAATGVWSEVEKNALIAALASVGIDVDAIVAKLPTDGNSISSDQQVIDEGGLTSLQAIQLQAIIDKLPAGAEIIASADDVASGGGLTGGEATQLQAIFDKLPVDGNEISSDQQVADATGSWSEVEKDALIAGLGALGITVDSIAIKLPTDNLEIASYQQVANADGTWSDVEKDDLIEQVSNVKTLTSITVKNTEKEL